MELFKICLHLSNTYLKGKMEHRLQFIMDPLVNAIGYTISYVGIWILLSNFGTIRGWTFWEMMLLANLNLFAYGFAGYFFYVPMVYLGTIIQRGNFDNIMLKPMNTLLYLISSYSDNMLWGHMGLSVVLFIFTFANLAIEWTITKVAFLILTLIGAILIHIAALLAAGSLSFWTNTPNSYRDAIFQNARYFITYPISIYGKAIQVLLTFVVPFAFINFYPAQYLLSKSSDMLFHPALQFGTPIIGIVLFYSSYRLWEAGVNHYESTGS